MEHLQEELSQTQKKAVEIAKKEKEVSQLQTDIETFLKFFN
jgi:hypothetical protein